MDARAKRDDERGRREEEMEQRNDESSGYESKIMENGRTKGGEEGDEDLYFEMEFPVQNHQWRAGTICSSSSPEYGSRSTLDSRDSPSRESRESSTGRGPESFS